MLSLFSHFARLIRPIAVWLGSCLCAISTSAAEPVDFARQIQPLLSTACYSCHGADRQKGELRLDLKSRAFKGGESGAVIVAGKPDQSLLIKLIAGQDPDRIMPAKGDRLTAAQVELFRAWVAGGAAWPDDSPAIAAAADKANLWSLKPIARPALPNVQQTDWARNDVDRFILAKLEAAKLAPNPQAERRALIRRVTFDLIGLPPTPSEVDQFLADSSPDAYEKVVDRLLASPRFGERWARHWLDIVRFADSHGFEMNQPRPAAWPYRDWVIQAFNQDLPYDQFVRQQIAGDALGADAATGFLVAGPWDQVKSPDPGLTAQQRADELHDMVAVTGSTFLGLTVGCARCHDHKFDPIAQLDYYRLTAVFAGVQHGERSIVTKKDSPRRQELLAARGALEEVEKKLKRFLPAGESMARSPIAATMNEERFAAVDARFVRFTITASNNGSQPCIDELEIWSAGDAPRNLALAAGGAKLAASGTLPGYAIHKLEHLNDGQYGNSHSWISNEAGRGWVRIELPAAAKIDRITWGRDREGKLVDRVPTEYAIEVADKVAGPWRSVARSTDHAAAGKPAPYVAKTDAEKSELAKLLAEQKTAKETVRRLAEEDKIYAGKFVQPGPTHRLFRGDPLAPKEAVTPGGLSAVHPALDLPADAPEQQRRIALANWMTRPENSLLARVIVNRLWHYHFGNGIVATPSDFGHMGARPTHPELLDYLASELIKNGWHLKAIHRLIVTSAAYRQSSAIRAEAQAVDAGAALLWRYPARRLEAEALRDSILAISGKLDLTMGGPGFDLFKANTNYVRVYEPREDFGPEQFRRMIYQHKPRMRADGVFAAFDCPDAGQTQPRRPVSTTPLQALNLLNSQFILQQAEFFAQRLAREAGDDPGAQVRLAFVIAFARPPENAETAASIELIRAHGLPAFCRALFNANEGVYVH